MDFSVLTLNFEIDDVAELVDSGHGVVPCFKLLAQLDQRSCDSRDNEFAGDQLTKSELLAHH